MAVLSNTLNLQEKIDLFFAREKKFPPESAFVNLLGVDTSFLNAFPTIEANNLTYHEYKQVTALPTVAARLNGEGTAQSKSESVTQLAHIKTYSSLMKIDQESYEIGGSGKEYVANEMRWHMAAQDIKISEEFFYGSTTDIKRINGISNTYNSLSGNISSNVISAGSVSGGDATSIWLLGRGGNGVSLLYPNGSPAAGFSRKGSAQWVPETDSNSKTRFVMYNEFVINRGYVIPDWRSCVRICNIDKSAVLADTTGATIALAQLIIKAAGRLADKKITQVKDTEIYMGRSVWEALQVQLYNKSNAAYSYTEVGGKKVEYIYGMKINVIDALNYTETTVS